MHFREKKRKKKRYYGLSMVHKYMQNKKYFFLVQEIALLNNPSSLNSYKISSKSIFSILKKI